MDTRCYAQRLLNPFRGVMNIIEYAGAEAVTVDGINWDIYVADSDLINDLENRSQIQTNGIRYGRWSESKGLRRGAIQPSEDFKVLEKRGTQVYQYLLQHHSDLPFQFEDNYELWLLNNQDQPLALINSVVNADEIDLNTAINWKAGNACYLSFNSPQWPGTLNPHNSFNHLADYLNHYINGLAAAQPSAQWFFRDHKVCTGLQGINLSTQLENRQLNCQDFPEFFINMSHHNEIQQKLLKDFFNWQAPYLLLLHHLNDVDRAYFEEKAQSQALLTDKNFRLYPKIINTAVINASRVEAVLRNSQAQTEQTEEETLACDYVEMGVTRVN